MVTSNITNILGKATLLMSRLGTRPAGIVADLLAFSGGFAARLLSSCFPRTSWGNANSRLVRCAKCERFDILIFTVGIASRELPDIVKGAVYWRNIAGVQEKFPFALRRGNGFACCCVDTPRPMRYSFWNNATGQTARASAAGMAA